MTFPPETVLRTGIEPARALAHQNLNLVWRRRSRRLRRFLRGLRAIWVLGFSAPSRDSRGIPLETQEQQPGEPPRWVLP